MFVAELRYPAQSVYEEGIDHTEVRMSFRHLETALADVAVCLELFRFARWQERVLHADFFAEMDVPAEQRFNDQRAAPAYWRDGEATDGRPPTPDQVDAAQGGRAADAAQAAARQQWGAGVWPRKYIERLTHVQAVAFIIHLHLLGELLDRAAAEFPTTGDYKLRLGQYHFVGRRDEPIQTTVRTEWRRAFPRLRDIRDSIAHADERLYAEEHGRPVVPKPWDEDRRTHEPGSIPLVSVDEGAPAPRVFQYPSASGDVFAATLSDGSYAEIPIVEDTVRKARDVVQLLIDKVGWEGRAHEFTPTMPPGETPRSYLGLSLVDEPAEPGNG